MADVTMKPDEAVFRADLAKGPFVSGEDRGRWGLLIMEWPHVTIAVAAALRDLAPTEYAFRFELTNYPTIPPTARPWDPASNKPLATEKWPAGTRRVPLAFNPAWKGGECLYLPCDRNAIEGHDAWRHQHPDMLWKSDDDITQYLRIIHDYINSSDYTGTRT